MRSTELRIQATGGEPAAWPGAGLSHCQHLCFVRRNSCTQLVTTSSQAASGDGSKGFAASIHSPTSEASGRSFGNSGRTTEALGLGTESVIANTNDIVTLNRRRLPPACGIEDPDELATMKVGKRRGTHRATPRRPPDRVPKMEELNHHYTRTHFTPPPAGVDSLRTPLPLTAKPAPRAHGAREERCKWLPGAPCS